MMMMSFVVFVVLTDPSHTTDIVILIVMVSFFASLRI
jgi:multisubunit Na+/H+ antiporter MnhF subunit